MYLVVVEITHKDSSAVEEVVVIMNYSLTGVISFQLLF